MHTTYVYIVQHDAGKLAVGYTDDIRRDMYIRRQESAAGQCPKLVYYETHTNQLEAIDRFTVLKGLSKSRKIWLIEVFNPLWDDLSQEWLWSQPGAGES